MPQPSKGPRTPRTIRFPNALDSKITKHAEKAGYANINDFVVDVVEGAFAAGLLPETNYDQGLLQISA